MSYEKELEYLRKEFNKSSAKFHQAEAEGYETDAEIWEDDMVNIGHQIHIHEQAAKADEYEAKAKAWDKYKAHMESYIAGDINEEEFVSDLESDYFESGEYDVKK